MTDDPSEKPPTSDVLEALAKVTSSAEFEGAGRLKEFLTYVVTETLDGRGHMILGKRIAQDVYGRRAEHDSETANVVRVDAGRLRRRLDAYYREEGLGDTLRIHVDKGGYTPRFSYPEAEETALPAPPKEPVATNAVSKKAVAALMVAALVAAGVTIWYAERDTAESITAPANTAGFDRRTERGVLFEASPASLQALNLAEEARLMMFPATQPARLKAALTLFEEAITLDASYYGGYAGAAQAAAMFGGLAPLGPMRDDMLAKARQYAETAVMLAPTAAWSQSALAFVNMFERNFDEADRLSKRAVTLDPDDLITLEIDAIIAFFSGDFERAQQSASPVMHQNRVGSRFPWRNVYGNASFYLNDYNTSVEFLLAAAENGEPVSEISTAHLIASLQSSGRTQEAKRYMTEYIATWPESRIEEFMTRLFRDPEDARKLMTALTAAGWQN